MTIGGDLRIDTYEALADLPIGAVIRDMDGEVGKKSEPVSYCGDADWQVLGDDRDIDGYIELVYPTWFRLPVDVLWPRD